jgi:hypothetical protein
MVGSHETCHVSITVPGGITEAHALGFVRVGDLDDVQRLVQVSGVLPPLPGVKGEDSADRRVGYVGHVGVPRIEAGPGDDCR